MAGFELIDSESESKAACMLKYSFSQFGKHARYLRLRGAICTKELCCLLDFCLDLQHLACYHIDTATQINHLCILLSQKKETLHVLEFRNCRFAENELLKISSSLTLDGKDHCQLRHLFVHSSRTLFRKSTHASVFILFLHACRALESLVLVDNQIDLLATSKLFSTISTGMLHLSLFHLRENELIGLSELQSQFLPQVSISMSLKALDIRSNYLRSHDIKEFVSLFHAMPLLELLNLSDNPIGDEGLAMLLPVLQVLQLSELSLSACDLSIKGACFLLDELTAMSKCHLRNLDISHNYFGSSMGAALAKFLRHGIAERVDVGDIGLGANGSLSLESALQDMPKLSHLILRKNRLGAAGAPLFGKLLAVPNSLRVVDFSSNLLDRQCLQSVANHLRLHGGMLDLVDLRNNLAKDPSIFSSIKQPEVLLSAVGALYDDDP
ncbi:hypothetical protein KP509_02G097700 [Ceratopteris richardii]|nr:hypothetical protein KP509_02G097700 [Ceratopteris richardii]